jgi:DNA-binding MarR family transcriptional regulator
MTDAPSRHTASLSEVLHHVGLGDGTIAAIVRLDALMQIWRRRMNKRELGHRALEVLQVPIDLAQFDVLRAIEGPSAEFGEAEDETTVGSVADRLAIDPSRASRLVTEMVTAGYARRQVSQADARRTVIGLTPAGIGVIEAVQAYKWLLLADFLHTWGPDDLSNFVAQLEHFGEWSGTAADSEAKFGSEIAALVEKVAASRPGNAPADSEDAEIPA